MRTFFFNTPVKGKVIIAFIIASTAIILAWNVSKYAFTEMLHTVENLSVPNDKLTVVNHLSGRITRLDQLQRTMAIDQQTYQGVFIKEFNKLGLTLDTLERLYYNNPLQVKHINFMRQLLSGRNKLFLKYLDIRKQVVNNEELSDQIDSLNSILSTNLKRVDTSAILTTEKKVSTTTVLPVENNQKGFLSRLFGKKKNQGLEQKVVNEELNITVDTIAVASQDNTLKTFKDAMYSIEKGQLQQSEKFVNRETQLALATNNLTNQMLNILQQVEEDAMKQSALNNLQARNVVGASIKSINIILISFLFLTVILLYFILTDISRSNAYRKELEIAKDEAEYHSRAKHRFLSNMSHEIRTPLQAIIGYTELLKKGKVSTYNINAIHHSSTHLMQIINEVLDYSRITSGKFSFDSSVFNLADLLNEVVSVISLSATEKSLELHTDFDLAPSEYIYGDAFRLKQILYNLLNNAVKYTDNGNIELKVSSKHHDGNAHLMFNVRDTGIGISGEDLKRVFNEFDQGSPLNKDKISSGSGLGLSIVKSITESLGGRIYVKSEKGAGSSFTLYLQFKLAEKQDTIKSDNNLIQPAIKGKIWLVDDDAFILQLCSSILESHNISHVCFDNPQEVLNVPWDDKVTCIFLDIRMPHLNGAELCSMLRNKIADNVKIYAMTAQALPEEHAEILSQGFDGLLMKPFKESELLKLINVEESTLTTTSMLDFDLLKKMTFGDETQTLKILNRFTEDSYNDIQQLEMATKNYDSDNITLLLHRIAGRTAQVGSKKLALDFRKLESDMRRGIYNEEYMQQCIYNLASLVAEVKSEVDMNTITHQV